VADNHSESSLPFGPDNEWAELFGPTRTLQSASPISPVRSFVLDLTASVTPGGGW
jgi:hypothetical protein